MQTNHCLHLHSLCTLTGTAYLTHSIISLQTYRCCLLACLSETTQHLVSVMKSQVESVSVDTNLLCVYSVQLSWHTCTRVDNMHPDMLT